MLKLTLLVFLCGIVICFGFKNERIVGGYSAVTGQFPFMVSIRKGYTHQCGGTILDQYTILTAASCVYNQNASDLVLFMGTNYLTTGGVTHPVKEVRHHENFNPETLTNDIGIVKTRYPIITSDMTRSVFFRHEPIEEGQTVISVGWGWLSGSQTFSDELQYVYLKHMNFEECAEALVNKHPIGEGQICSGESGSKNGHCFGDQGGPLLDYDYRQLGIASWSSTPCGSGEFPDVYTSIADYEDWIDVQRG